MRTSVISIAAALAMLGPPFAKNLAYTYHSFWASTERSSIQRHLNFANRHNVPLFLGETGEFKDVGHHPVQQPLIRGVLLGAPQHDPGALGFNVPDRFVHR